MKIPEPRKISNGKWFIQLRISGKSETFSDFDKKKVIAWAASRKAGIIKDIQHPESITAGQAFDRYIESKDSVLSPSTIAGYKRQRKNCLQGIMSIKLEKLTQEMIQKEINKMSKDHSPKYVRNAHGLLSAVLAEYLPGMILKTTMPQKVRYDYAIPSDEDIDKIIEVIKGTDVELPVMLSLWLGMRMSEVRGIRWDAISGNVLHIKEAIVDIEKGSVTKGTKTFSSDRKIMIPEYIMVLIEQQPKNGTYVIDKTAQAISKKFYRLCEKAGIETHYRYHDLRHANASVMLALNVPDKYAMKRGGWATNNTIKSVYQHTMETKEIEVANTIDDYFNSRIANKNANKENESLEPQ